MSEQDRSLTADELRRKMYQFFKKRGLHDTLKAQLRNQLIMDLKHDSLFRTSDELDSLSLLMANSLIIHHLQNCSYEYTLSIFYPECGLNKDNVFSAKDILHFLKINPLSSGHKNLVSDFQNGQKGLLVNLLSEFIDQRQVHDADTQTSNESNYQVSIVKKMQLIDEEYDVLRQKGSRWASVEAKLMEYRKELEEQAQMELKSKIEYFQEGEIAQVRMVEKEKCQQELQEIRHKLERTYKMKSEALISREKNAIERLQKQQEVEEKEIYCQRQALLKEIESVRNREAELRLRIEAFEKSCKLHEEKMRNTEELMRKRELDVRRMEEMYDLRLNNEIKKQQLELKEHYNTRTETLEQNIIRNKEEMEHIQREAALLQAKKEEFKEVENELRRTQEKLASAQSNVAMLVQKNVMLEVKLEGVGDWETLSKERTELQNEVGLLKKRLEKSEEEKQRLRQELSTSTREVITLQSDLRRTEMAWRLDKEDFLNQRQLFHYQLSQEVDRCAQLKAQLQKCEERTKCMTTRTEEINRQDSQQALEDKFMLDSKPLVEGHFVFGNAVLSDGHHSDWCNPETTSRGHRHPWNSSSGTAVVAEALTQIQKLVKEAETLEETYRSYKQKAFMSRILFKGMSLPPLAFDRMTKRATFAQDKPALPSVSTEPELNQVPTCHVTPPTLESTDVRRLSSTPVSVSKTKPSGTINLEGFEVIFSDSQRERVSPIPTVNSEENLTTLRSPQLKSTAHHDCGSQKLQIDSSSSRESSPQPEKINIHDLTHSPTDDDANNKNNNFQRCVEDLHEQEQDAHRREKINEEKIEKEAERSLEEKSRRKDTMEAQERQGRELQKLQQHEDEITEVEEKQEEVASVMDVKRDIKPEEEKKRKEKAIGENEEAQDDPLHKYMMMVMHERDNKEIVTKEDSEIQSPNPTMLSDHRDSSLAATSHEADDDEFW